MGERTISPAFWEDRRVVVTGGAGFLGSYVVERLEGLGCRDVFVPRSVEYDLTRAGAARRLCRDARPDLVLHLAARVGGIGAHRDAPGAFFYENAAMGIHLIEEARRAGVDKFVQIGTICSYPKHTPVPFREEDLWNGYPDETTAPYGIAKRALLEQLRAYRCQYGFNGVSLLPVNLYGPRDDFDPAGGHVVAALIRKMEEARSRGEAEVVVWGTGEATREFLYADDCARAILLSAEHYDEPDPVNLGSGAEVPIRELASLIAELVGFEGRLAYDPTKPDGQPRRCVDTSRALERFGFRARVPLREGLRRTIEWYREAAASGAVAPAGEGPAPTGVAR